MHTSGRGRHAAAARRSSAAGTAPSANVARLDLTGPLNVDADAVMTAIPKVASAAVGGVTVSVLLPIAELKPLLEVPGMRFVSLQYGDVSAEVAALERNHGIRVEHWPEVIASPDETANDAACTEDSDEPARFAGVEAPTHEKPELNHPQEPEQVHV